MKKRILDPHALDIPRKSGLSKCLHLPIAARNSAAIKEYVGEIIEDASPRSEGKAFLVKAYTPEPPDNRLKIWKLPQSSILNEELQVWVHHDFNQYRAAFKRALPNVDIQNFVLDHVLNRREAAIKGLQFIRLVKISRSANSSHGGLSERWGVNYHSSEKMRAIHEKSLASIQYADLCDIVKMLDMNVGDSIMSVVNQAQELVDLPKIVDNHG